jgi:small nuclear ribonucleoprotein (snRNP)-like protein
VTDETKTLADRAAAAANARDRAEKFRAQGEAARTRVPVLQTLLKESVKEKGPLSLLARAMEERRRVRVRTRHASGVRGEAYAYVKAFDRHLNLILADVTETSSQRARIQRRAGASEASEGKTKNAHKLVWRTRRLAQIFVRGEQVVLVAVEGDREEGGT